MAETGLRNYAYLGDAVWELFVREKTITVTNNAKTLHKITTDKVRAGCQCELLHFLSPFLTEQEQELARRARNLPIPAGRKNIQAEYRHATAFEALIGWWYNNDKTRYDEIINILEPKIL